MDEFFTKKMEEISEKEKQELAKIEPEIVLERKKYLKLIQGRLDEKKNEMMQEHEARLNEFRKKGGQDEDYQFADMIAQYGE